MIKQLNAEQILLKARTSLLYSHPFFATLALRLIYVPKPDIEKCYTEGTHFYYNPAYIESLDVQITTTLLADIVMHVALLHPWRRNERDITLWNKACDYAITPILKESKFLLPDDCLYSQEYEGKHAELIYNCLPSPVPDNNQQPNSNNQPDNNGQGDDQSQQAHGFGGVEDAPTPAGKTPQQEQAEIKSAVAQACLLAKRAGNMPGDLERLIEQILKPRVDWKEALARFLAETSRNDYTWTQPNPRYIPYGLYLPALKNEEPGTVALIIDTSISINEEILNQFAAEIEGISNIFKTTIVVIYVDTKVQNVQTFEPEDNLKLEPKGKGGTDFRPGFEYIDEHNIAPKAIVYLTDGECNDYPDDPGIPTLWAIYGDYEQFEPAFGEKIEIPLP